MPGRLEGKVAVITGAASGIGRASAVRFAREGAHVVVADLADEQGSAVAGEVEGLYVHADVTEPASVAAMYAAALERFGTLDICFNNAGISPPDDDSILETDLDAWRRVQDVNLTSVYLCCKAAIPILLEHGGGSIINTASFVALMGAATSQISYTASKGGVLSMSRELGVQFARQAVRVNALCPGPVNTPLLQELFATDARARRPAARARADGPLCRAGGDRGGGVLLGLRRRFVHHRQHLPRRRRSARRLRDAALRSSELDTERPVIGVTAYDEEAAWGFWRKQAALLPAEYVRSLAGAGANPVIVPVQEDDAEAQDSFVRRLDALVFTGGPDLDPARYGAARHPRSQQPRHGRDEWELALLAAAERTALPVLAICRGMQLLNVARGGTLIQHLPDVVGHDEHNPTPGAFAKHLVTVDRASLLHEVVGWDERYVPDPPSPGHRSARRRPRRGRVDRGRHDRGRRGPGQAFPDRRAVARRSR